MKDEYMKCKNCKANHEVQLTRQRNIISNLLDMYNSYYKLSMMLFFLLLIAVAIIVKILK